MADKLHYLAWLSDRNTSQGISSRVPDVHRRHLARSVDSRFLIIRMFRLFLFRYNIMRKCWEMKGQNRPSFQELVSELARLMNVDRDQ